MLKAERGITVDLSTARSQARDVVAAISYDGARQPAFARASQNVAAAATLLNTLPTISTDGADRVYP
jgi:hypothetical protein